MSDAMIDEIAIIGNEDEIQQRIQEDADSGVHTHIIAPLAGSREDTERTLAAFTAKAFQFTKLVLPGFYETEAAYDCATARQNGTRNGECRGD